jgi:hypothetical protein
MPGGLNGFTVRGAAYEWQSWVTLDGASKEPVLPREPGLYRIRRVGSAGVDYIGQTGVGIRARVRMLRGIWASEMPYRDPHTAAPALWALIRATRCEFEVSALPVLDDASWRKGLEAVAIALYRQECGRSPTVNFGRMPSGFRMSSGNTARLVAAGKRFRGGPSRIADASHRAGIAPTGSLGGDPYDRGWCGHRWSAWLPLEEFRAVSGSGLYRLRSANSMGLLYIGQGALRPRLAAHHRKTRPGSDAKQEQIFARATGLEFSYVIGEWEAHERLELETDLIGAHVLKLGRVPPAQFVG